MKWEPNKLDSIRVKDFVLIAESLSLILGSGRALFGFFIYWIYAKDSASLLFISAIPIMPKKDPKNI